MNNNVVEKTLKSIDNIDRLSDLAAISIYNTSHEAIDKFDVMQEHATPEYVEGEFVQESLLTGVLIGAGIIGVAISAFLIIKKIIESKAKGDPNAAPNSIKAIDLRNPDDIDKVFTKWEKEYFGKYYQNMVIENIKGASPSALGTYAETLTKETNDFITNINDIVDTFMSGTDTNMATDEQMVQRMHALAESLKGAINIDQLEAANITKDTIGLLKSNAISIAKSFRDFDNKINESIKTFEAKSKQQPADSEDVKNATETMIKNFSNALKGKAKEIGAIMDSIRSIFEGFQTAIENGVREEEAKTDPVKVDQAKQFISSNRKDGMTDYDIKMTLADQGFTTAEIDLAFKEMVVFNDRDPEWSKAREEAKQRAAEGIIDSTKVNEAIRDIKTSRKLFKHTDDEIKSNLIEHGFTEAEIEEAFKAVGENSEKASDDDDPTKYIDHERAKAAAARESTEDFSGNSSDNSAEQSTNETFGNIENIDKLSEDTIRNIIGAALKSKFSGIPEKYINEVADAFLNNGRDLNAIKQYYDAQHEGKENKAELDATTNEVVESIQHQLIEALRDTGNNAKQSNVNNTSSETPENQTGEDNIREIVQRLADQYGFNGGNSVDIMINQLSKNNNDANALRELNVDDNSRDDFNKFVDAIAKELGQNVSDETSGEQSEKAADKAPETPSKDLFTEEEEEKITNAVYAVKGLDRKFRQEIYNAVTDDGFAEAANKLYAKYADDANKLNQINTTLIAMAKSIGKESEVLALPTADATPTESETSAENQTPEQTETPSEATTTEPQSPSDTTSGVVTDNEELKKIADDLGLPLGNFIEAYDKVKEGNADYTESQMLTTVFNNQIAFNQFTLPAINEAIAKEYDKCKQVADAVHAPFNVEPITIDDATFEKLHAYFDQKNKSVSNMETAKLIPGVLADMVMDEKRSSEIISPEASENTETGNKTISVDDPAYMEKFNEAFSKAPDDRKQGIMQSIKSVHGDLDTYLKRFYHGIDKLNDTPERKAKFKNGRYNSIKTLAGLVGYTGDLTAPDSPRKSS